MGIFGYRPKTIYDQRKFLPEKKNTLGKKKYRYSPKGVSECGKKTQPEKKVPLFTKKSE